MIMHKIAQSNRVKNAIQCGLQVLPGLSYIAFIKARAFSRFFHAVCKFNSAFHEFDYTSKSQFFRFAQEYMPTLGSAYAARYSCQAQLA